MAEEKRFRAWVFTVNNYTDDDENAVYALTHDFGAKYVSVGREVGESGTPHLQGYVYFKEAKTMSSIKRLLPTAHFECARSIGPAIEYTQKDGDFFEDGDRPMTQEDKGVCGKRSIEERWELAKQGRFQELPPEQIKTYEYIHRKYVPKSPPLEVLDNYWIVGEPRTGKSNYVVRTYDDYYEKTLSEWWDGYEGQPVVFMDEIDVQSFPPKLHAEFKKWTDGLQRRVPVKGGMTTIQPKTWIVVSNYTIDQIFGYDPSMCRAVRERFKVINFTVADRARCGQKLPWVEDGAPGGVI